jgi:hypothetical protein
MKDAVFWAFFGVKFSASPAKSKLRSYAILRDMRAPKRILPAFCVHSRNGSAPCLNCYSNTSVDVNFRMTIFLQSYLFFVSFYDILIFK